MDDRIASVYGGKVRVRACGILWQGQNLLMINHDGIEKAGFWSPPGGGVEFGEPIADTLRREFREETGLQVSVGAFRFGCEFLRPPLHAIELFFDVTVISGSMQKGFDPELPIIRDVRYLSFDDINSLADDNKHGVFRTCKTPADLLSASGFLQL